VSASTAFFPLLRCMLFSSFPSPTSYIWDRYPLDPTPSRHPNRTPFFGLVVNVSQTTFERALLSRDPRDVRFFFLSRINNQPHRRVALRGQGEDHFSRYRLLFCCTSTQDAPPINRLFGNFALRHVLRTSHPCFAPFLPSPTVFWAVPLLTNRIDRSPDLFSFAIFLFSFIPLFP